MLPGALAAALAGGWALARAGVPAPYLFAGLLVGITIALARGAGPALPRPAVTAAHGATGVTLGLYVDTAALAAIGDSWLPVALVTLGTLVSSLGAGLLLARVAAVHLPTATLGLIAGGASGIVAMADEIGADGRLVAFMQYLRVLIVVAVLPLVLGLGFGKEASAPAVGGEPVLGTPAAWALTFAVLVVGVAAGRRMRVPAPALMGPLILAALLVLVAPGEVSGVPPVVRETAFALIGLEVGLRFTVAAVRNARSLLLPLVAVVAGLLGVAFGLAVLLALTSPIGLLDAYLATNPGGIYAVVAASVSANADTTFVVAVQSLRLLAMMLLAPLAVRLIARRPARAADRMPA